MSPLLFALVDAVLCEWHGRLRLRRWCARCTGLREKTGEHHRLMAEARIALGAWRSLWGVL